MSQNHEARTYGLQPPLPLVDPDEVPAGASPSHAGADWRLDEHTREIGRRGIAAARAALHASSRGVGDARRMPPAGGRDRAPGRAA